MKLIIISGQSGAGKSVALRVLEDLGYYCVDNLPISLLEDFLLSIKDGQQNVAVSVDIRNLPQDPTTVTPTFQRLKKNKHYDVNILFLDAHHDVLLKRYSETRRIHPLSILNPQLSLEQAIEREKEILQPIKEHSDLILDSTNQSIHDLSEMIRLRIEGRERKELIMVFQSFGFKYGLPKDADFIFDVRFLPNPHWQPELRTYTGLEAPVKAFLEHQHEVMDMKQQLQSFIEYWLPSLQKNNRSYLTVAIGCTGGKHRSVYLAQQLGEYFIHLGYQVQIRHHSLEKHHSS